MVSLATLQNSLSQYIVTGWRVKSYYLDGSCASQAHVIQRKQPPPHYLAGNQCNCGCWVQGFPRLKSVVLVMMILMYNVFIWLSWWAAPLLPKMESKGALLIRNESLPLCPYIISNLSPSILRKKMIISSLRSSIWVCRGTLGRGRTLTFLSVTETCQSHHPTQSQRWEACLQLMRFGQYSQWEKRIKVTFWMGLLKPQQYVVVDSTSEHTVKIDVWWDCSSVP